MTSLYKGYYMTEPCADIMASFAGESGREKDLVGKYINDIRQHWSLIKDNIDTTTMSCKFRQIGWLTEFRNSGSVKRSVAAEHILVEVVPKILTVKDIVTFEDIVGMRIKKIIESPNQQTQHCLYSRVGADRTRIQRCQLQLHKDKIKSILKLEDVVKLKDTCLECGVITLGENAEICRNGFYDTKKDIFSNFIENIIDNTNSLSPSCIIRVLETLRKDDFRGDHVERLLKTIESDLTDNAESNNTQVTLQVAEATIIGSTGNNQVKNFKLTISLEPNEEGRLVCAVLAGKPPQYYNMVLTPACAAQCTGTQESSVIIFLQSLDGNLVSRLKACINNNELEKIIQMIFNDNKVKNLLTPGKHKLVLELTGIESSEEKSRSFHPVPHVKDAIADNRSFLIEEIDTELTLRAFETKVRFCDEDLRKGRSAAASHIIDVIIKNKLHKDFLTFLEEKSQTFVKQRLDTYEQVYNADTKYLAQNVLAKFPLLIKAVNINEIRDIFIERKIFNKEFFFDLNKKCDDDSKSVMVNFLIAILQSEANAVLTFIDALFIIQQDELATDILNSKPEVILTGKDDDMKIKWRDNLDDDVLIKVCFNMLVSQTDLSDKGTITASSNSTLKFEEDVRQPPIKRPPSPVDQSFRDDVKAWKKIRSETIPRLDKLERELRSANENIKTARTVRNWTIGLSVLGGILFAPFTGGGSFAAAAAISGGTTGVVYFIEMFIEKDVLETTQEGINKDKAETIRLRTRITSYQGGHKRTEEFVHDLGNIALDAIFVLSQNPLLAFIASFVDNNSMSLLNAIDQVISLRIQLDRELRRVEEVEGCFY